MNQGIGTSIKLHHEQAGSGPPLVILHGLFGSSDNFRSVAIHLERRLNVIRVDLPAHGLSGTLPCLTFEAMAEAVVEHLNALNIERCYLMGHSLGGKVAMAIAGSVSAEHIERVIVVDIAPRLYPPHHDEIFAALLSLDLNAIKKRSEADKLLRTQIPEAGVRAFLLKSLYTDSQGQFKWRFKLQQLHKDYEELRKPPPFTQRTDMPALFIKGGDSDYLAASDEKSIRDRFSKPTFKEIGGTGHWLHAEKPGLFTKLVKEFLGLE